MLSSKELIIKTGISRATLNNYIGLGLLSKPLVQYAGQEGGGAKLLGYFPDWALERIELVKRLKKEGLTMAEIVARVSAQKGEPAAGMALVGATGSREAGEVHRLDAERRVLQLSIDEIPHAAYMVNHNFELTWYNDIARQQFLGGFDTLPSKTEARNVFLLLMQASAGKPTQYRAELLRLHLSLAKDRLSRTSVLGAMGEFGKENAELLETLYNEVTTSTQHPIVEMTLELRGDSGESGFWHVYATFFREGILFVYVPGNAASESLLEFLSRRDVVIRNLLRRRLPVLTQLAVLVADLQNSVKICSELPPEEYFELINEIWSTMGPIFRKFYGTHGKHVGDGMVYYFFPQPDSHYVFNALACAHELKLAMRKISKDWQFRKDWFNELYLNTGLHEGQEWLGTFQSATSVEFAVLGDTINHSARLSDFARFCAIWATKTFIGKLSPEERAQVEFGITRRGQDGQEHFVTSTYSQMSGLVDLNAERYEKLREIAALPITEIRSVRPH